MQSGENMENDKNVANANKDGSVTKKCNSKVKKSSNKAKKNIDKVLSKCFCQC